MYTRFAYASALLLVGCTCCFGWGQHHLMTGRVVQGIPWVQSLQSVTITEMAYDISPINPEYEIPYEDGQIGQQTSAATVLALYSDEPDWGPDQELDLSWQQKFMGGTTGLTSRGYFHCYFPAGNFNIPTPGLAMGAADERAAYIFGLARKAAWRGDMYWALRFTAWTLHYLQDLSQPYHSTQSSRIFYHVPEGLPGSKEAFLANPMAIQKSLPSMFNEFVQGTTRITVNYHFAWERYAVHWIRKELAGEAGAFILPSLDGQEARGIRDVAKFARKIARKANKLADKVFPASLDYFGPKFHVPVNVSPTEDDFTHDGSGDSKTRLRAAMQEAFVLYAIATRSLCELLRQDLCLPADGTSGGKTVQSPASFEGMEEAEDW